MIKVYGIKNCNKIRDTRKWLDENSIEYEFVDLKKDPLTREELELFAERAGLDNIVNRRGMTWRRLGLSGKNLSEEELLDVLLENQTMIKRPLMTNKNAVMTGYDEKALNDFLS